MRRHRIASIAAFAALGLAAACGGGSKPQALPSMSPEAKAFLELGVKGGEAKTRVTFHVSTGEGDSSEVVVSQRPPVRSFRVTQGRTSLIVATEGGDVVSCGEKDCYRIPGLGSSLSAAASAMLGPLADGFDAFRDVRVLPDFRTQPPRTIAGRSATCGRWTPEFSPDGFTMCLDAKTGAGLFYEISTGGVSVTLEATKVDAPADADFMPPYPVTDLPTGYAPPTS